MATLVMKFGGTSMAGTQRIAAVAALVAAEVAAGHRVAVVVSAMAGETDRLVALCHAADPAGGVPDAAEYDAVVASGEQVSAGLLALALHARGLAARSWQGWQLPIATVEGHAKARISTIATAALAAALDAGEVAVIPGFQGVSDAGRITTLGRGGSDTSAVAVAAALGAERCDIYTDVDGVYTTDPRIASRARRLDYVTYEEMLELASVGAKVLQTRSVGLAMKMGVRVRVLSSFAGDDTAALAGTMIVSDAELEEMNVERQLITGIAADRGEAKITLTRIADRPGAVAAIFGPLAAANINVDMIIQNIAKEKGETDVTFTVPAADLAGTQALLEAQQADIGYYRLICNAQVAKVSVVGVGMKSHAGVASTMFRVLAERGINIQAISTSEIKVSVLIDEDAAELAVRVLHSAYGLDAPVMAG